MEQCKNCKTSISPDIHVCSTCSYPIGGTSNEQASFIAKQVIQKSDVTESIEKLKEARGILLIIAAFNFIAPFIPIVSSNSTLNLIICGIIGLLFTVFALLTYRKPVTAIGISLAVIVFYYLMLLFLSPVHFYKGLIWKVMIITGLTYGFLSVRKANKILKENKYLASVLGYSRVKNK